MCLTPIIVLQKDSEKWRYTVYPNKQNWIELRSNAEFISLKDKWPDTSQLIILPTTEELNNIKEVETIPILITKGTKEIIHFYLQHPNSLIWEVKEKVDISGKVLINMEEPEMNKALRFIFTQKSKKAYVILTNTYFNPLHQESLKNILFTAGVKTISPSFL